MLAKRIIETSLWDQTRRHENPPRLQASPGREHCRLGGLPGGPVQARTAGRNLALIVTDGCLGLAAAIEIVFPRAVHQRCWAHKLCDVASKLPRKHQGACLKGAVRIFLAENGTQAAQRFREWKAEWRMISPKAVSCLEDDMESLLAFFSCPRADWRTARSTNAIERSFREVRRRTRPMSCFQNGASCERIIYALFSHLNQRWSGRPLQESTQLS